ncbi:MAG: two component, sigma54 specific, transcriptional regulator, Fis family, partial [Myxococcaceae bacterium]|nr:two component, sigma54 specific, transcriptional regulator, Fis family [Myxococcaceae bacterium]
MIASETTKQALGRILIVEDEPITREGLKTLFLEEGYEVAEAADGEEALIQMRQFDPAAVLCDVQMPRLDGLSLLRRSLESGSDATFIMMTGFATVENAVEAMRLGAESYLVKPLDVDSALITVEKAIEKRSLRRDVHLLNERLQQKHQFSNIVGESPELQAVFEM